MKQENITSNIESSIRNTGNLAFALDIKGNRQVLDTSFKSFEAMQDFCKAYNEEAGKDVIHPATIVKNYHHDTLWSIDEERTYEAMDAKKTPYIYGDEDNTDTHVVAFEDLADEADFLAEAADDMEEDDADAWRKYIKETFAKIAEEMTANDVLVYTCDEKMSYEICPRFPMSWDVDHGLLRNYKLVIAVNEDIEDED